MSPAKADAMVFVVDDDDAVRDGLRNLIRSIGLPVDTFASADQFLAHQRPDVPACLILDIMLPGRSGLVLSDELARTGRSIPIIFITGQGTIPMSVRAMKSGAIEFLTKPFQDADLVSAIERALGCDRDARRQRDELAQLDERFGKLTPREHEVMAYVVSGSLNKEIAARLGTVEQTVKVHRGRVMKKLGVESVADLVRLVQRRAVLLAARGGAAVVRR
jgi:FixJ family two-component response regulator